MGDVGGDTTAVWLEGRAAGDSAGGEVGAGKTTLVKGIAAALGAAVEEM